MMLVNLETLNSFYSNILSPIIDIVQVLGKWFSDFLLLDSLSVLKMIGDLKDFVYVGYRLGSTLPLPIDIKVEF